MGLKDYYICHVRKQSWPRVMKRRFYEDPVLVQLPLFVNTHDVSMSIGDTDISEC